MSQNILPPTLPELVLIAANFDDQIFEKIGESIKRRQSTDFKKSEIEKIVAGTSSSVDDLQYFLALLSFLYAQMDAVQENEIDEQIKELLQTKGELDADKVERLTVKLSELLKFRDIHTAMENKLRLTRGFGPFVVGVSSFVDRRTDFNKDDDGKLTGKIDGEILVVQLGIATDSAKESERRIIVNLDEDAISLLREALDEIDEKLKILKKHS